MSDKKIVTAKDASVSGNRLRGTLVKHPNYTSGKTFLTSPILGISGNRVETINSIYIVESWGDGIQPEWILNEPEAAL